MTAGEIPWQWELFPKSQSAGCLPGEKCIIQEESFIFTLHLPKNTLSPRKPFWGKTSTPMRFPFTGSSDRFLIDLIFHPHLKFKDRYSAAFSARCELSGRKAAYCAIVAMACLCLFREKGFQLA